MHKTAPAEAPADTPIIPEARAGRGAQQIRRGHRVVKGALVRRARDRQRRPDKQSDQGTGHTDLPNHGLLNRCYRRRQRHRKPNATGGNGQYIRDGDGNLADGQGQ